MGKFWDGLDLILVNYDLVMVLGLWGLYLSSKGLFYSLMVLIYPNIPKDTHT
jgi:hypothetical protein